MSTVLLLALVLPMASAAPVAGGAQVAVYPAGIELVTGWFEGETYELDYDEVGAEYSCYDELGIRDFNLDIPLDSIETTLRDDYLDVRVEFGTIHGEDMEVYGLDEDYFDLCIEFDSDLLYITVTDPVFEATLQPRVQGGELIIDVLGSPSVTGDLDMDIDWWPDDLVLAFYEETIFETLSETASEMIPELVAEAFDQDMLSGAFDDYAVAATLDDADVSPQALFVGADLDASWTGEASCDPGAEQDSAGREPQLDLSDDLGSTLAIGLTEYQLNALMRQLMADGFFCFDPDRMDLVYEAVEELFDPGVANLEASASLGEAPVMVVESDGADVLFQGIVLEVAGTLDGQHQTLLRAEANLGAVAEIGANSALAALTMSLHDLDLQILDLEAEHLLSDSPDAEEHLVDFLEGWVAEWIEEQVQGIAMFATQYHLYGTYLRLDRVLWMTGGVALYASLYDEDDPAVDLTPPDTQAWLIEALPDQSTARLAYTGNDDKSTELAFTWQLDGSGWAAWTTETEATLEDLLSGTHVFEVKSRDGWLNEDTSPASVEFDLDAVIEDEEELERCGCASRGGEIGGWWLLLASLLPWRRRNDNRAATNARR